MERKAAEIPKSSITAQHPKLGCNVAESSLVTDQGMEARARIPNSIPPGQGFSPSPAGPVSLGCRRHLTGLYKPVLRYIRDQNTHSQRPCVSRALLAEGKESHPWVSSHDILQFLSQGHLPDLAFPPQKKATSALDHTSGISALSTPAASTRKTQTECKYLLNPSGGLTHPHTRL